MSEKTKKSEIMKSQVSKEKVEAVKKLAEEMKNANTIMLVSIKSLPASQLQKMKKSLREQATIRVAKKSLIVRAVEATGISELMPLA